MVCGDEPNKKLKESKAGKDDRMIKMKLIDFYIDINKGKLTSSKVINIHKSDSLAVKKIKNIKSAN